MLRNDLVHLRLRASNAQAAVHYNLVDDGSDEVLEDAQAEAMEPIDCAILGGQVRVIPKQWATMSS